MMAPRRQSLPVPHMAPSFIPAWAPVGPDAALHSTLPSHSLHTSSQANSAVCNDAPRYSPAHQDVASRPASAIASAKGNDTAAEPVYSAQQPQRALCSRSGDRQCSSPEQESYQSVPAVNITVTGGCSCSSPSRQTTSPETCGRAQPAGQHCTAKLDPEASLAYLHQPTALNGQAGDNANASIDRTVVSPDGSRQDATGEALVAQGVSSCVDTTALQKEVTELRQQVYVPAHLQSLL